MKNNRHRHHHRHRRPPLAAALLLGALASGLSARADMPQGDPARGRELARACDACHGAAGISKSAMIPNLAGQPAAYMAKRLVDLRAVGRKLDKKARRRDIMAAQARLLSGDDIAATARYFSRLACR